MDDKNTKLPSKHIYFGALPCACFENTVVSNRNIIMNICDPKDRSLINLQISFKHVNFIRMVRNQLNRALILHVSPHCAKRIQDMFSSGAEAVRQYFIPESEDWSKKFVMVDVGDSNRSELETLQAILTVAANKRASLKQNSSPNGGSMFFSCTSDSTFGSLMNRLISRQLSDDLKPSFLEKRKSEMDGELTVIPKKLCKNVPMPLSNDNGIQECIASDDKQFVNKTVSIAKPSLDDRPGTSAPDPQKNSKPIFGLKTSSSISIDFSSIRKPLPNARTKFGNFDVVATSGNIRKLVAIDLDSQSRPTLSSSVTSSTRTVASCLKNPDSSLTNTQKQVQVLHSNELFTIIADIPLSKESCSSTLIKKNKGDSNTTRLANPKLKKTELIKERERLRSIQHDVILQYPPEADSEAIKITAKDIDALQPGELINDNIVSFYLKYIRNELVPRNRRDSFFFFDTFFYSSLTKGLRSVKDYRKQLAENYETVRRRTRKVDLFSKDYIVVPICEAQHWYVAVITFARAGISTCKHELKNQEGPAEVLQGSNYPPLPKVVSKAYIVIMDSFVDYNETKCYLVMESLLKYLEYEYSSKRQKNASKNEYFDRRRFDMLCPRGMPQQTNVYDCGIFMLKFLEYFLVKPPEFLRRSGTFLRWYPKFDVRNTRENILKHLKKLCPKEKWKAYLEYRRKDDYFTSLIGDRTPLSPISLPEPEPLRRTVSESDLDPEVLPTPMKKSHRRSLSFS